MTVMLLSYYRYISKYMIYCFIIGTFLFSFSIYGLTLSARNSSDRVHEDAGTSAERGKWKFLGPITPIGGLLLVAGWALLLYQFIGRYF